MEERDPSKSELKEPALDDSSSSSEWEEMEVLFKLRSVVETLMPPGS